MPSGRGSRGGREVDLRAAVDEFGCEAILNGQDKIAKSIIDAELDRVPKMLARPARELAFDPQDADVSAAPVSGGCKIVQVTQACAP